MKRNTIITLAAGLLPWTGLAEEKPLWEVQVRLDGGKNESFQRWIKELFGKDGSAEMIGDRAVFRIAGFENADTPEDDWVAEIRNLADPAAVMKEIEAEGKADGEGRFLMKEDGVSFLVWRDGDALVRLAGPPGNAGTTVSSNADLKGNAFVAGWVDLGKISELEELRSATLSLPDNLSFSVASEGTGISVDFRAGLESRRSAEAAKLVLEGLKSELTADEDLGSKLPPVAIDFEDRTLIVRVEFTRERLDDLIGEMKKAIKEHR